MIALKDVEKNRRFNIDGRNYLTPTSVFLTGERGYCIELDREEFIAAILQEFQLEVVSVPQPA